MKKSKRKRVKGSGEIGLALVLMLVAIAVTALNYRKDVLISSAQDIDNDIKISLLGSAMVNLGEYGSTGEIVIFENLGDNYLNSLDNKAGLGTTVYKNDETVFNSNINMATEFQVASNESEYLNKARDKFKELITTNLELDENLVPRKDAYKEQGIILEPTYKDEDGNTKENKVNIEEYTVVNVYKYREPVAPYREHTYTVTYRSKDLGKFELVNGLSGIDKDITIDSNSPNWTGVVKNGRASGVHIDSTTVYARISFYTRTTKSVINKGEWKYKKQYMDRAVAIEKK